MDDKKLENELRQHETTLPEALLPENMKRRLMEMSEEEKKTRSESVPEYSAPAAAAGSTANAAPTENTGNAAPAKKKGIARYVFPVLAAAASLFLAFQLGVNMDAIKDRIAAPAAETASVDEGRKAVKDSGKKSEKEEKEEVEEEKPETGVVEKPETGEDEKPETEVKDAENPGYAEAYKHLNAIWEEENRYYSYDMPMVDYAMEETMEAPAAAATEGAAANSTLDAGAVTKEAADFDTAAMGDNGVDFTDTNVRTAGVAEGDVVKTDGKYIYEYDDRTEHIRIYQIGKGEFEEISSINLVKDMDFASEMFISEMAITWQS